MNVSNIFAVADAIENGTIPGLKFNMGLLYSPREEGTAEACIAAYAGIMARDGEKPAERLIFGGGAHMLVLEGAKYLGINMGVGLDLFTMGMTTDFNKMSSVTAKQAARCLRNLAITGKVSWDDALKDNEPVMPALPVETGAVALLT